LKVMVSRRERVVMPDCLSQTVLPSQTALPRRCGCACITVRSFGAISYRFLEV
jgi:hypothetical protein